MAMGADTMTTEATDQGEQIILPGAERSARQVVQSREDAGRGKMRARVPQKDPAGLFAPIPPSQPGLFDRRVSKE